MILTKEQAQRFHLALLSAFPGRTDLAQMVKYRLDKNLEEIVPDGSLSDLTFELIRWAESVGSTMDLVSGALAERPRNPDLQSFAAESGLVAPAVPAVALRTPLRGKAGILVDLSHAQSEWETDVIFSAAKGRLVPILQPPPKEPPWDLKEIPDRRQLKADGLKGWSGLLMGMPYHERIEDSTRYEIVKWVRAGGRLVLLGFELGERHHETNLNELADEFGLRFNSDIVAPAGWQPPGKPYDEPIDFMNVQSAHPTMNGISRLRLRNLCTLTVEPGADVLLTLGENALGRLQREGVKYTSQGWIRGGNQKFEVLANAGWVPVIAEAPVSLTGTGSVLAIGTWQLFGRGYNFPGGFDNLRFVANLLDWLGSPLTRA